MRIPSYLGRAGSGAPTLRLASTLLVTLGVSAGCALHGRLSVVDSCACRPVVSAEHTHWGGNEAVIVKPKATYRVISGVVVLANGEAVGGALAEVFTNPLYLLEDGARPTNGRNYQRRLGACKTDSTGRFCFAGIAPGDYELRVSKDRDFNVSQYIVIVDPTEPTATTDELLVELSVGT